MSGRSVHVELQECNEDGLSIYPSIEESRVVQAVPAVGEHVQVDEEAFIVRRVVHHYGDSPAWVEILVQKVSPTPDVSLVSLVIDIIAWPIKLIHALWIYTRS